MGTWEICNELRGKKPMASVFVFCCHHVPQLGGLKQQQKIYFLIVVKAISLKSRWGQGYVLSEGSRKESGLCLCPSSQSYWQSLACRHTLQPLPPSSHGSTSFSLSLLLPSMRIPVILDSGFFLLSWGLIFTSHICNNLIFKKGHILRFQEKQESKIAPKTIRYPCQILTNNWQGSGYILFAVVKQLWILFPWL